MSLPQSDHVTQALDLRRRLVRYLRHGSAVGWWRSMIEAGQEFELAPSWRSGTSGEQARRLAGAELDRIESGPVLVVEPDVLAALGPVFDDPTWRAALSEDLLPAASGMVCFPGPVFDHRDAKIATFTWGANHSGEPRQPLTLSGWVKPDRHTAFATGAPIPKDAPLIPAMSLPLAYSPHANWHLAEGMETADFLAVCARAVTALWYALDASVVSARQAKTGPKDPVIMVLSLVGETPVTAVREAIDAAWKNHVATGGHGGDDDVATVTAASGAFAVERDAEVTLPVLRDLPRAYRDLAVSMAQIESSATERWPQLWSTLDRHIASDIAAKSSGDSADEWVAISVAGVAKTLSEHFGAGVDEVRRYASVVAGLAAWRAAGRHAVLLPGDQVRGFPRTGDQDLAAVDGNHGPVPFLLEISDPNSAARTLCFTSVEIQGPRFWVLNFVGEWDSIDSLDPEWTDVAGGQSGRGLDDVSGGGNDAVIQFCMAVDLRIMGEPERLVEVGELLRRRPEQVRWPSAPDPGCLTLWVAHPGAA